MSVNIVVPELGESVVEARVARWLKKEGDRVSVGETLVELETDKIDLEVGATQAGVLVTIARREGEDVQIGEVLGVIGEATGGEESDSGRAADASTPPAAPPAPPEPDASRRPSAAGRARSTPSAARLAREHHVNLDRVRGTGERGRITRRDVEDHMQAAGAPATGSAAAGETGQPASADAPPPTGAVSEGRREERVRMSKRRQTIARRLVEAQRTAAMLTTFNEIDMTGLVALRERYKQTFKDRHGVSLGIASFFVKASIAALRAFPRLNAEIQGDEMVLKHYYDIGVAVGARDGLVVPVIRDADRLSFAGVERAIRTFAAKANDGTLALEDLRGGTFTLTNGGVFGSLLSTPILNPPQVGILGLHKIEERTVPIQGEVAIRPMMYVALSYDHRIVDGLEAVQFLVRIKELIEDPAMMILSD